MANILLVEDHDVTSFAIVKLFTRNGHNVDVAIDGRQAINKMADNTYDVVVTDLAMPLVTGQQLIDNIRNIQQNKVKILVVSSLHSEQSIQETFVLGADDFLPKPFQANDLLLRIQKLLRN